MASFRLPGWGGVLPNKRLEVPEAPPGQAVLERHSWVALHSR